MSEPRNEYPKRPSSKDTGVRTGERRYGKKNYDERGGYGKKPYGERDGGKKPYGERDGGKKPYGERGFSKNPYGQKQSDGDRRYEQKPNGKKPFDREDKKPFRGKHYEKENRREPAVQNEADEQPYLLIGRNAVREAIKSDRSIDRVLVTAERDGSLGEIVTLARERKLVVREVDRKKLDELCLPFGHGGKTANHQGIVAYAAGVSYCDVADILGAAKARGEAPFVIVLDGVILQVEPVLFFDIFY